MPRPKDSLDNHGTYREAQQTDPALYYSFVELRTRRDDPEQNNQLSRDRKHRRARKPLQAVDRPNSFLDLGESDARMLYHPAPTSDLPFGHAHETGVGVIPPSGTVRNSKREQGKPGGSDTNGPGLPLFDPSSISSTTGEGTPLPGWSTAQSPALSSRTIAPSPLLAQEYLEDDRLPCYEEAIASTPVNSEEHISRWFASRYSENSYHINCTKESLPSSPQDTKSQPPNPVVVQSTRQTQRITRPLPRIPSPNQSHAYLTPSIDAEGQSLHVDELNIAPLKPLSKMEKALLRRIEFGSNVDCSRVQLS